jgi:PAS domain S-box-containing protein
MTGPDVLEALPVAVYVTDAQGRITFYNSAAAQMWGRCPDVGCERWCGSLRLYWPDGRLMPHSDCPMATTLKEGEPVRGVEVVAERPDGTRVRLLPHPTPLRDESGRVTGAVNLLMDLSEQDRRDLETARLAAIVASSDDAIISKTLEGRITSWNEGAAKIFGYESDEMVGQPITRIIPPELHHQETDILSKLKNGEHIDHYETVRTAKDGRRIDISLTISPLRDRFGNVVGASKVARDVTLRKEADRLRQLLVDELNHRVKNVLATVQALASQSLRHTTNPADFVSSFSGRVQALARVHTLLTEAALQGADVGQIVRDQVLLGAAADERIACSGPLLMLEPRAATHLALILHELGTNARKYGTLSVPSGRLSVTWSLERNGGRDLHLIWEESGGPKVNAPAAHGFGTMLIQQTLRSQGGEAFLQYAERGVTCQIRMPLVEEVQLPYGGAVGYRGESRPRPVSQPVRSVLEGRSVLVVEDEAFVAMEIETTLSDAGCTIVGPVATVECAKTALGDNSCDAALLDANLAGHPVDELAAILTQKSIPFAFVTGYGRDALPQAFRESPVLFKPFNVDQLLGVVSALLSKNDGVVPLHAHRARG